MRRLSAGPLAEDEWERLREQDSAFGFGPSRDAWIESALSNSALVTRSEEVTQLIRSWHARRLVAVGAGTGSLEYLLKTAMPELGIRCGDWGTETVNSLRQRFPEAESVERMDLRKADWVGDPAEVVLLNRVDMELSDSEWSALFVNLGRLRVSRIIWIPCGLLTATSLLTEVRGILAGLAMRRQLLRAGYLRTPDRMLELFSANYARRELMSRGDLPTWGLHLRGDG